ncbi:MAG: DUF3365 domain-containing protein [Coriobacteriales bacterium]|jgi:signal transduction histidine kinase|nr:DUF3365 domain-containing protein [Coriobacteriales bacterium]
MMHNNKTYTGFRSLAKKLLRQLRLRSMILPAVMAALLLVVITIWRSYVQHEQIEREMLETTQVLGTEMSAVWDFMERNQIQFVRHEDGTYNLYCVVAAKAVAKIFTNKSDDFVIRYTNISTRKPDDAPDEFEARALNALASDPQLGAYFELVTEDEPAFRYVEPLYFKESCLECHGQPAGELDIMGYPKEGKNVGDLAGAASIIMPAQTYVNNMQMNIITESIIFAVLLLFGLLIIFWSGQRLAAARMRGLEEVNRQQSSFLTIMSHEIRTPLTSILAFADIWQSTHKPRNAEEESIMREMRISSQILLAMVNNILETARADAGRLELMREPVEVCDLLGATRAQMSFLAEKKQVHITVSIAQDMPVVLIDEEKVRRILENLISNAIKFVSEHGNILVSASYDFRNKELLLSVSDDGCGISLEDQPHIFDRFVQGHEVEHSLHSLHNLHQGAHKPVHSHSGSGLGLAVVKELAELHGGSVHLKSNAQNEHGSTFIVRLPASYEDEFFSA